MAISPRGDLMEIKETFWQKAVIEEQAISVLQKKNTGNIWMIRRSFGRSKSNNGNTGDISTDLN